MPFIVLAEVIEVIEVMEVMEVMEKRVYKFKSLLNLAMAVCRYMK